MIKFYFCIFFYTVSRNVTPYFKDSQTFINTILLFTNKFFWVPLLSYRTKICIYKKFLKTYIHFYFIKN